jgi:hypothetical protein
MKKQQEFFEAYTDYTVKTFKLMDLMFRNLNPAIDPCIAAEINHSFHSLTDTMERMTKVGEEAAKEQVKQEEKSFIPLAN